MRKWILNIHMYGGLLVSSYLIIFGISSLNFNHHFKFAEPRRDAEKWEQSIQITLDKDNNKASEAVRDQLGLMGWPLPWKTSRAADGTLTFDMERPGKSYTLKVLPAAGDHPGERLVHVEARRKGYWPVINSLHALNQLPNSTMASVWGIYTEVCTFVVLFCAASGIYLFTARKNERLASWIVLGGAAGVSAGLMLYARFGS